MSEEPEATRIDILEAVNQQRKQSTVRSLDMSFNELADMVRNKEIEIKPAYQRMFRWSAVKQSQFIESVLLEMPIPPIYVVEKGEGSYELIDGLQRLSTFLHLRGELDLQESDGPDPIKPGEMLTLTGCTIVPILNGCKFTDLPTTLKNRARRATLRVEIVRHSTNPRFAYHMFTRLNMGGEPLSDQEARNCSIRLINTHFNDYIGELARNDSFRAVTDDTTEEFRARQGLEELVLRFFAFKNNLKEYVHDIGPFLTDYMERVTDTESPYTLPFDYSAEKILFARVFTVLQTTLGNTACRRWVGPGELSYGGGFSMSHYEAFSIGLSRIVDRLPDIIDGNLIELIKNSLKQAKRDPQMKENTVGGGKNFRRNYERKFEIVERSLRSVL